MIPEFLAQAPHMGVHSAGVSPAGISRHIAQKGFAGENPAAIVDEREEQLELDRREVEPFVLHRRFESCFIDHDAIHLDEIDLLGGAAKAAQKPLNAENDFLQG
jgi:hypothetical protein